VTTGQQVAEIMQIQVFYDDLKTQLSRSGRPSFWRPIRVC